jgi:DNA-binding transcriptional regulator WhiA
MYHRMRLCVTCQVKKEESEFYLRNKTSHLYQSECKKCANAACRERARQKRIINPKKLGGQCIYSLNENIFADIDTQEKAYWLGFLFADGYNSEEKRSITLGLASVDKDHIQKFREFLSSNSPVKVRPPRRPHEQPIHIVNICSTKLSKDLAKLGCMQAKTFKIKFPIWMDSLLWRHFIRGYFDGDGSVGIYRSRKSVNCSIAIVSNQKFLSQLKSILKSTVGVNSQISKTFNNNRSDVRCLYSGGNRQTLRFLQWIYGEASTVLDRKYQTYKKIQTLLVK